MTGCIEKLTTTPSPHRLRILLIISLIGTFVIYPVIAVIFQFSGDTVNFMASQLSFSGPFMKAEYALILAAGGMAYYFTAQLLDYGLMLMYGILFFTASLAIYRKLAKGTRWRSITLIVSLLGPVAAILDSIENGFLFAMASDPIAFPDVLAVFCSSFSLGKWVLLFAVIAWLVIAWIISRRVSPHKE
nr:hypothetical protein [Candidatus Sigynarchaeota archaeon]